jgi:hypothetical protein
MIPKQLAAVRIELVTTVGLITRDNEDSLPVVGQARAEQVARKPYPQIPERFEFVGNSLKRGPIVGAEEALHIFQDKPARFAFCSKLRKFEEEAASGPFNAPSLGVGVSHRLVDERVAPAFPSLWQPWRERQNLQSGRSGRPPGYAQSRARRTVNLVNFAFREILFGLRAFAPSREIGRYFFRGSSAGFA